MKPDQQLFDAILNGDAKAALAETSAALARGVGPEELVSGSMIPAMDEVGRRFEAGEYYVPELMISGRAMKKTLDVLRPLLARKDARPRGRIVIGTVEGDLHDIGKNLVAAMLEGGGFEVFDLGANVSPSQFVQAVKEKGAGVVGLSALLTTTMPAMKTVIAALKDAGVRKDVKVIVGGAPISSKYAEEIGADAYGENAFSAVTLARQLAGA
jgi:corrinoid protein of di/trimethylamine methyltransferase